MVEIKVVFKIRIVIKTKKGVLVDFSFKVESEVIRVF